VIKIILHKIFSVSLALLVLFSTVSFTIEKHFCGNTLVDVSLFTEADKCKMEAMEIELENITKKPCCKDTVDLIEGQDELNINSNDSFKLINKIVVTTFVLTYLNLYEELPTQIIPHKNYSPPNLVFDRQVLDQVFLI
jgi:hypothetical protein